VCAAFRQYRGTAEQRDSAAGVLDLLEPDEPAHKVRHDGTRGRGIASSCPGRADRRSAGRASFCVNPIRRELVAVFANGRDCEAGGVACQFADARRVEPEQFLDGEEPLVESGSRVAGVRQTEQPLPVVDQRIDAHSGGLCEREAE
jgi:hypothetical protein